MALNFDLTTDKFDPEILSFIQTHASELETNNGNYVNLCQKMEELYNLKDTNLPSDKRIKQQISTDPANKVDGASQLLRATDPQWRVPTDGNNSNMQATASKLENAIQAVVDSAGRVAQKQVWYEPILSAVLYGRAIVTLTSTKAALEAAQAPWPNGFQPTPLQEYRRELNIARAQAVAAQSPILFNATSPKLSFPELGKQGLTALYIKQNMTVADIHATFGTAGIAATGERKSTDVLEVGEWWDALLHGSWLSAAKDKPLLMEKNKWGFIPGGAVEGEGSSTLFYDESMDKIRPFLYKILKSNTFTNQNLALTVLFTNIFTVGAAAHLVYYADDPTKEAPEIDWSVIGGVTKVGLNEKLEPLGLKLVPPELLEGLQIINQKSEDSTMYAEALGHSAVATDTYSTVALLQQAGRLPLTVYQRALSLLFSDLGYKALRMIAIEGGTAKATSSKGLVEIKAADIPEQFLIDCNFEIALPQDVRANIAMAMQATQGPDPLLDKGRAREVYLKQGQPDQVQGDIWAEKFAELEAQKRIQIEMAKTQWETQIEIAKLQQQYGPQLQQVQQQGGGAMAGAPGGQPGGQPGGPMPAQLPPGGGQMQPLPGAGPVGPGLPMAGPGNPQSMPPESLPGMGGGGA